MFSAGLSSAIVSPKAESGVVVQGIERMHIVDHVAGKRGGRPDTSLLNVTAVEVFPMVSVSFNDQVQ